MVHGLEIEYWGDIEFAYLDLDSASVTPFQEQRGFRYQPQLILLDGEGNIVQELAGNQPESVIREALDNLLAVSQ